MQATAKPSHVNIGVRASAPPAGPPLPLPTITKPISWRGLQDCTMGGGWRWRMSNSNRRLGLAQLGLALDGSLIVYLGADLGRHTRARACAQTHVARLVCLPICVVVFRMSCIFLAPPPAPLPAGYIRRGRCLRFLLTRGDEGGMAWPIPRRKRHRWRFIIYANQTAKSQVKRPPPSSHLANAVPTFSGSPVPPASIRGRVGKRATDPHKATTTTTAHQLRQPRISR